MFDCSRYTWISSNWRNLLDKDSPNPSDGRKVVHWAVVWMSIMNRQCWNRKQEALVNRLTIHVRLGRPCTVRTATSWIASHFGSGGRVMKWDGCDLIEHVVPYKVERAFMINYWLDTGPDAHSPWIERPATYLSTWGTEVRPLASNSYAIAQGDRAIRNTMRAPPTPITGESGSHRMIKESAVLFSTVQSLTNIVHSHLIHEYLHQNEIIWKTI